MRKLTLTVHALDVAPAPATEYLYQTYAHDGLFRLPSGQLLCRANNSVSVLPAVPSAMYEDQVELVAAAPAPVGISEMTLLKALALAQKPELALELCK